MRNLVLWNWLDTKAKKNKKTNLLNFVRNKQTHVKQKRKLTKLSTEKGKANMQFQTLSKMYMPQKK